MGTTRRFVLTAAAAGGALLLGWSLLPPRQRLSTAQPLPAAAGQHPLNGWVKLGADDTVTVMLAKSEMGQGVFTALAQILAEELDADWARVRTEPAPVDAIYNNIATVVDGLPFHPDDQGTLRSAAAWLSAKAMREVGVMMTGGSSSVKDLWLPMREAGASARAMLVEEAAARWGVAPADCRTAAGQVQHAASGRSLRYGELAEAAARRPLPARVVLKEPKDFSLIGKPLKRLDAAAKQQGTATYGIDAAPPGLRHAAVLMCPVRGGRVVTADTAAAEKAPGVQKVLTLAPHHGGTGGVAVVAANPWQAKQALALLKVQWDEGPMAGLNSQAVMQQLAAAAAVPGAGLALQRRGDVAAELAAAAKVLEAEYTAPYLAHEALEPINATVWLDAGGQRATVWAPTQVPGLARGAAARVLGLKPEQVELHVTLLGGGFGRRLEVDFVAQAAEVARALPGVPVQLLWSREDDLRHDFYRPACVARFKAGLDAQGALRAWQAVSAGQAILPQVLARTFGLPWVGPDKTASEGGFDQPYEWPASRVAHELVTLPVPVGFWRSVGHSHQAFFKEGFLDECAHAAGQDPVVYRSTLLQQHPRHRAVLQRAAALAGWGTPTAPAADGVRVGRGIALHQSFGSTVAQVVEASVGADKAIRVHRVVCVIDCGLVVNPGLVRQQLEGSVVFALSAALHGEVRIEAGRVLPGNFHEQPIVRSNEVPAIVTDLIASTEPPEGVGEPAVPPLAPALANAVFAATGQRLRSLPLRMP